MKGRRQQIDRFVAPALDEYRYRDDAPEPQWECPRERRQDRLVARQTVVFDGALGSSPDDAVARLVDHDAGDDVDLRLWRSDAEGTTDRVVLDRGRHLVATLWWRAGESTFTASVAEHCTPTEAHLDDPGRGYEAVPLPR